MPIFAGGKDMQSDPISKWDGFMSGVSVINQNHRLCQRKR